MNYRCCCCKEKQSTSQIPGNSQTFGSQWDAGIPQMLIITQAVNQIEDKIQQEMLTNGSKKEGEKQNKRFPQR